MQLRLATLNDYKDVHNMYNAWKHVTFSLETYQDYLKSNILFVVEKDGKVVGTCKIILEPKLMYNKNVCHVEDVVVSFTHRQHGVGSFMVQEVMKWCKDKNVYKMRLGCLPELEPFYSKNGLKRTGCDMACYFLS